MTTCPACGVAVVPGYVKCPRCAARLPSIRFRRPGTTADAGGTAVEAPRAVPWIPIALGVVVAGGIIGFFAWHAHGGAKDEPAPPRVEAIGPAPTVAPTQVILTPAAPVAPVAPAGPRPEEVAATLEHALKRQRLWSTVRAVGTTLDIRSGSCGDAAMPAMLDAAIPGARAAGLTRLRCVEQSGTVALTRDL